MTLVSPRKAHKYFKAKMEFTTGPAELDRMTKDRENINIVDVRAREDYEKEHIPGAINLPKGQWETCSGLSTEAVNVVYCYSEDCHLAPSAALEFSERGFPVMELDGGFEAWKEYNLPVEVTS
jgi:rhodanese-related sulfurtransferase